MDSVTNIAKNSATNGSVVANCSGWYRSTPQTVPMT
jgi:hypothetical protein